MSALGPNEPNIGARVFWLEQVSETAKLLSRSQVPNQFSGNIGASKISFDSSFELPVVRAPAFNLAAPQRSYRQILVTEGIRRQRFELAI
jgi:hypothetical protein